MRLTEKQIACLREAANFPINPWHFGSTTISVLKRAGYIKLAERRAVALKNESRRYTLTEEGRMALKGDTPAKLRTFEVVRFMSLSGLSEKAIATVFARDWIEARGTACELRVGGYPSTTGDWDTREVTVHGRRK